MLNVGESLESLESHSLKGPLYLMNVFFLQFSLWLLSEKCAEAFFGFDNRKLIYQTLTSVCTAKIDCGQSYLADMTNFYPSLNFAAHGEQKDGLLAKFITRALSMCQQIRELYLSDAFPVEVILEALSNILSSMKRVDCAGSEFRSTVDNHVLNSGNDVNIVANVTSRKTLERLLSYFASMGKHPSLFLIGSCKDEFDLSKCLRTCIGRLHLFRNLFLDILEGDSFSGNVVSVYDGIQCCPFLTHISFVRLAVDDRVTVSLSKAMEEGKPPVLSALSFEDCELEGNFSMLFKPVWPSLVHLEFTGCYLERIDMKTLSRCKVIGKRILAQGNPGMGKSTGMKNLAWLLFSLFQ